MKVSTAIAVAAVIVGLALPAEAASKKDRNAALAQREASCKAQAAQKYSAIRFMARREHVNKCMGQNAQAKAVKPKAKKNAKTS
jgi:hypothetical protein